MPYDNSAIIPVTEGRTRIRGLDINWTSMSEIIRTSTFGADVIDAVTGLPVNLVGKPTFSTPELTTPYTKDAMRKLIAWLKTDDAVPGKSVMTTIIDSDYYTHTGCTVGSSPINPGHDANSDTTTARFIRVTVNITVTTKSELVVNQQR